MPQRPKIAGNMLDLIGYTPLVRLNHIPYPDSAEIICKLESQNPMDSVKDRIGAAMLESAEKDGRITPGKTIIIEPTSGNTGIALAFAATVKGYKLIVTMPDTVTVERRRVLTSLGAEVVLTPGAEGMKGAIKKAADLSESTENAWTPGQFENPANPEVHRRTTAEEIWEDTDGRLDAFRAERREFFVEFRPGLSPGLQGKLQRNLDPENAWFRSFVILANAISRTNCLRWPKRK